MLVSSLREYKEIIKIYSDLTSKERALFYNSSIDPIECIEFLNEARFHYIEVRKFRDKLLGKNIGLSQLDNNYESNSLKDIQVEMTQDEADEIDSMSLLWIDYADGQIKHDGKLYPNSAALLTALGPDDATLIGWDD